MRGVGVGAGVGLAIVVVTLFAAEVVGASEVDPAATAEQGESPPQERSAPPDFRGSLQIRFGESNPMTAAHDVGGLSAGFVYGKYLGVDLSLDSYELFLDDTRPGWDVAKIAELSLLTIGPTVRFRYPLLDGELEPYLLAGGGVAIEEVNDRTADVQLPGDGGKKVRGFGVVGGGIDWFFAENTAVGVEGRYFIMGSESYDVEGNPGSVDLNVGIATLNLRVLYPQGPDAPPVETERGRSRFSFALRVGGALPVQTNAFPGVRASAEQPVFGTGFTTEFGATIGYDFNRWFGIDLAFENYELKLTHDELGSIGEYSVFPITVQPRVRLPGLPPRWEPYGFMGVGAELTELNDKPNFQDHTVAGGDTAVIGTFGAGLDYYFATNAALGLVGKYVISRGHDLVVDESLSGNLDSFLLSLSLKVLFGG